MFVSKQYFLSRDRMIAFLDELEASCGEARSFYIPPGLSVAQVKDFLEEALDPQAMPPELYGLAVSSGTGAVLFWSASRKCLVMPPFPVAEKQWARGCAVEPLRACLRRDARIALVLVRLGAYAVGLCEGERLISSKVGTGLVHGRHRQGGSSAQRFHLHREKQIESFLDRVCTHVQEQVGTLSPDYLAYGGARTTILRLQKRCPFLRRFDGCVLPSRLDIGEPRRPVLEAAVGRVWSSRIVEWTEA